MHVGWNQVATDGNYRAIELLDGVRKTWPERIVSRPTYLSQYLPDICNLSSVIADYVVYDWFAERGRAHRNHCQRQPRTDWQQATKDYLLF